MPNIMFTNDINLAIINIAYELKRSNDLKEKELILKYGKKLIVGDI